MKDYYELLEVSKNASKDTIKKVFRMMIKKNHPDLFEGEEKKKAEERVKELNQAYEVLINDESRKKYDEEFNEYNGNDKETIQILTEENEYLKSIINEKNNIIKKFLGDNSIGTSSFDDEYETSESDNYYDKTEHMNNANDSNYTYNAKDRIKKLIYMITIILAGIVFLWITTGINLFKIAYDIFKISF